VSWSHDGEGVQEFRIRKETNSGDWTLAKDNISSTSRSFTLTNSHTKLVPGRDYKFTVVAVYAAEPKESTDEASVTMPQATGPRNLAAPDNLLKREQLTVTWDAPDPAWDVNGYRADLYRTNDTSPWKSVNTGTTRSANFTGLE
jgi:hypothetical protein